MISGSASREQANCGLWTSNGETGAPAHRVALPGLPGFEKTEDVSPAFVGGRERIVLVKDDGIRSDGLSASSRWTRRTSALADFQPLTGGRLGVST